MPTSGNAIKFGTNRQGDRLTTRRELLISLGLGAFALQRTAAAQLTRGLPRVGWLDAGTTAARENFLEEFRRGMRDVGYVEGKNIIIEYRWTEGKYERLPALAAELVQSKVAVIVASTSPAIKAAQGGTTTIPIVMVASVDPVGAGFIASLSRPGGNVTGLSNLAGDVSGKYLELLRVAVPKLSRVAVLMNPGHPNHPDSLKNIQATAMTTGVNITPVQAPTASQLEAAFGAVARERAGALIVLPDALFNTQRSQIAELAMRNRLPTMFWTRELAEAGGLMSYGQNNAEQYRRAATYLDKILKGAMPGDLPVEQATRL